MQRSRGSKANNFSLSLQRSRGIDYLPVFHNLGTDLNTQCHKGTPAWKTAQKRHVVSDFYLRVQIGTNTTLSER
jgi:hypothetical protein